MSGAPVAMEYTYDFVGRHLPDGAADVLEIGCGAGELAARLSRDGLRVVALDADEGCVTAARAAGVDARLVDWPAPINERFDAVLFTRSLHHICPLDGAVAAAVAGLRPGGRIIVEDFRAEGGSERSKEWFAEIVRTFGASGALHDAEATLARVEPDDHELHSSAAIAAALARCGRLQRSDAAYYFRYLEAELPRATTFTLLRSELAHIEKATIDALGTRFVLTPQ